MSINQFDIKKWAFSIGMITVFIKTGWKFEEVLQQILFFSTYSIRDMMSVMNEIYESPTRHSNNNMEKYIFVRKIYF